MPIALDAGTGRNLAVAANSLTYSHTCTGSNGLLLVHATTNTTDDVTGITYAGAAMTQVTKIQTPSGRWNYLFYKLGPATGANNVVISTSDTPDLILSYSASYTGVSQSGFPDSSNTATERQLQVWQQPQRLWLVIVGLLSLVLIVRAIRLLQP